MKRMMTQKQMALLKSNSGLISIDFLFGFLLSFAFLMIFFALAYSLTVVEVVQYIAFASSRAYMAADINPKNQKDNAEKKAAQLKTLFAAQINPNWFVMGSANGPILNIRQNDTSSEEFTIGVQIPLTIKLLDFKIPFFGRTKVTNAGEGFQTQLSSYLIREPTEAESNAFNDARAKDLGIKAAPAKYDSNPDFYANYHRISDNG